MEIFVEIQTIARMRDRQLAPNAGAGLFDMMIVANLA